MSRSSPIRYKSNRPHPQPRLRVGTIAFIEAYGRSVLAQAVGVDAGTLGRG